MNRPVGHLKLRLSATVFFKFKLHTFITVPSLSAIYFVSFHQIKSNPIVSMIGPFG